MIITIAGTVGSGKSTVGRIIAKRLGLKHYSIGDLMREMAEQR
jgi:cytidylate kinase